jgi:hypothetical protein
MAEIVPSGHAEEGKGEVVAGGRWPSGAFLSALGGVADLLLLLPGRKGGESRRKQRQGALGNGRRFIDGGLGVIRKLVLEFYIGLSVGGGGCGSSRGLGRCRGSAAAVEAVIRARSALSWFPALVGVTGMRARSASLRLRFGVFSPVAGGRDIVLVTVLVGYTVFYIIAVIMTQIPMLGYFRSVTHESQGWDFAYRSISTRVVSPVGQSLEHEIFVGRLGGRP